MLQPHFDTFGQRLLWASSFAGAEGLTTQLKQEPPLPPLAIGQQRQITCLLDDLAQETHGFFQHLAGFAATMHIPDKTRRPIHQYHGPSLGRVWSDFLVHPRVQLIPFDHLLQKLMRQGKQEERFFTPLRRSCQR